LNLKTRIERLESLRGGNSNAYDRLMAEAKSHLATEPAKGYKLMLDASRLRPHIGGRVDVSPLEAAEAYAAMMNYASGKS
jgi:hypothetical protein